jgi:hypothetical protein
MLASPGARVLGCQTNLARVSCHPFSTFHNTHRRLHLLCLSFWSSTIMDHKSRARPSRFWLPASTCFHFLQHPPWVPSNIHCLLRTCSTRIRSLYAASEQTWARRKVQQKSCWLEPKLGATDLLPTGKWTAPGQERLTRRMLLKPKIGT